MKGSAKPAEILTKLNELVGFAPDEEIELFEVFSSHYLVNNFELSKLFAYVAIFARLLISLRPSVIQEIKFEPSVMCEHIDKKLTFRGSQVCITLICGKLFLFVHKRCLAIFFQLFFVSF